MKLNSFWQKVTRRKFPLGGFPFIESSSFFWNFLNRLQRKTQILCNNQIPRDSLRLTVVDVILEGTRSKKFLKALKHIKVVNLVMYVFHTPS